MIIPFYIFIVPQFIEEILLRLWVEFKPDFNHFNFSNLNSIFVSEYVCNQSKSSCGIAILFDSKLERVIEVRSCLISRAWLRARLISRAWLQSIAIFAISCNLCNLLRSMRFLAISYKLKNLLHTLTNKEMRDDFGSIWYESYQNSLKRTYLKRKWKDKNKTEESKRSLFAKTLTESMAKD